ncbi:MAG: tetratricopeptide repeat protein [Verrucomicrobiales bacterium]|nr:tetratricopeptide repeat protein [Verrucomicrobiales bacterium]MCP5528451.1 tetratricopeptide repeat protein [Verrucomicrobiales bacterium]
MKRIGFALLGVLLWFAPRLAAQTPDEMFVGVYNLVLQGDSLQQGGQESAAQEKYGAALQQLKELEARYPYWNRRVVEYRLKYLEARVKPEEAAPAEAAVPAGPPPTREEVAALRQQVEALQAARAQLEAKLQEALSAQPAAVDPRELEKARGQLTALQKENELLKANLAQQEQQLSAAPDAAALDQARKAVTDLNQALAAQKDELAAVTRERDTLKQRLAASPGVAVEEPTAAPDLARAQAQVAELTRSLETEKARAADLEKQVQAAASRPAAEPSIDAATAAATLAVAKAEVASLKTSLQTEQRRAADLEAQLKAARTGAEVDSATRLKLEDLENERDALRKRVSVLTRQLDEFKLARGDESAKQLSEQLSVLRARIQVYEAQSQPYTTEEMALMRQAPVISTSDEGSGRIAARELPAGVAGLVSDAERAFRAERYDEAETKYLQALEVDEKNVHLLANLAAAQVQQGKLEAAETTLNRALAEDAMDPDSLSLKGLIEFRKGDYDAAEGTLSKAAQLSPENPLTQNYLGVTLSQKGLRKPAETAFRKAIQIDPGYAEAHYNLAVVYARQQPAFPALARWHYEKAVAGGQPRNPELEQIIADAAKEGGE